jgi:hypothetical protein
MELIHDLEAGRRSMVWENVEELAAAGGETEVRR